jgi:hypothetical protein
MSDVSQDENQGVRGDAHDPLCRYRDDVRLARHDCGECNLIARVRADEREQCGLEVQEAVATVARETDTDYQPMFDNVGNSIGEAQ